VPPLAIGNRISRAGHARAPLLAAIASVLGLVAVLPQAQADLSPPHGSRAVATENDAASRAALAILDEGGNAIDAAVTAALVAGVASPSSSGLGGGGFALVFDAKSGEVSSLDFRETAPAGLDTAAFERRPLAAPERGKMTGTPGEPAGLWELHRRFGKKRWADVVAPAVKTAQDGYVVSPHLARAITSMATQLSVDGALASLFTPGGQPVSTGIRVKNLLLARTLSRLSQEGPKAFYEGTIASELAATARSAGGALTTEDLAAYRPVDRAPLHVSWEGYEVFTMGPPSAGGLLLGETLGLFSAAELRSLKKDSGAYQHVLAEGMRLALADRLEFIGDPEQAPADLGKLLSKERLAIRKKSIALDQTRQIPRIIKEDHGTHHMVTADSEGNVVSLTTTVNNAFGSLLSGPTTGILLNDQLDDFTPAKVGAMVGLSQIPNHARARARAVSSMTPTIVVRNGVAVLALGGSGGMTIAPNVTQALLSRLVFGTAPGRAVEAPRFGVPIQGSTISLDGRASAELRADLQRRGELVSTERFSSHAVQMIAIENGKKYPAADPRKFGIALAH
jgi:gamma-glutamyltranspeptidase/glutathione hydrolase